MVQIITDRGTGHYKVIVVGHHSVRNELVAHLYFSMRGEWVSMKQGRILPEKFFGIKQCWNREFDYVLYKLPEVSVCTIITDPTRPRYKMRLYACRGFLLFAACNDR
jgi:hypothetical protein